MPGAPTRRATIVRRSPAGGGDAVGVAADTAPGIPGDSRAPMCLGARRNGSDKRRPLNLSQFVARKIWRRDGVSALRCRAYRLQRHEPLQYLLVLMDVPFALLQTAIN